MGFPKRYDTSPSAKKRQFSPTFRKPGGKKCKKRAFFGSFFENCRIWRSMRKYKLCTSLDASCQCASFATLLGSLVGHRAEKTSKNLLKNRGRSLCAVTAVTKCGSCGLRPSCCWRLWPNGLPGIDQFQFWPPNFSRQLVKVKNLFWPHWPHKLTADRQKLIRNSHKNSAPASFRFVKKALTVCPQHPKNLRNCPPIAFYKRAYVTFFLRTGWDSLTPRFARPGISPLSSWKDASNCID